MDPLARLIRAVANCGHRSFDAGWCSRSQSSRSTGSSSPTWMYRFICPQRLRSWAIHFMWHEGPAQAAAQVCGGDLRGRAPRLQADHALSTRDAAERVRVQLHRRDVFPVQ